MLPEECVTLCRICLGAGAQIPIFELDEHNVYEKLYTCLHEKIKDIEGYPRYICLKCNEKLHLACEFINKYKDSCKILQYGVVIVKEEKIFDNDYKTDVDDVFDHNSLSDTELDIVIKTKIEPPDSDDQKCLIEFVKGLPKIKTKKITATEKLKITNKPKPRKPRTAKIIKRKANAVATCILEGNFMWDGEKWCSSKEPSNIKFMDPQILHKTKRKRKIDLGTQIMRKKLKNKGPSSSAKKLCDLCGEVFKNQERLLRHRDLVHFPKKLKCPKCPKVCHTVYYLNRHIKRQHDKKNFICAKCGKEYAFLSEMNSHIKNIHKKGSEVQKKVYACSMCDKTYACMKSVTIHERSVHTGERPAVCSVCDSSFTHEDYLKEHMRLHTGETPFKCPVCGRGYAQRCNMKSHIKQHKVSELDSALRAKIRPNYLRLMKP